MGCISSNEEISSAVPSHVKPASNLGHKSNKLTLDKYDVDPTSNVSRTNSSSPSSLTSNSSEIMTIEGWGTGRAGRSSSSIVHGHSLDRSQGASSPPSYNMNAILSMDGMTMASHSKSVTNMHMDQDDLYLNFSSRKIQFVDIDNNDNALVESSRELCTSSDHHNSKFTVQRLRSKSLSHAHVGSPGLHRCHKNIHALDACYFKPTSAPHLANGVPSRVQVVSKQYRQHRARRKRSRSCSDLQQVQNDLQTGVDILNLFQLQSTFTYVSSQLCSNAQVDQQQIPSQIDKAESLSGSSTSSSSILSRLHYEDQLLVHMRRYLLEKDCQQTSLSQGSLHDHQGLLCEAIQRLKSKETDLSFFGVPETTAVHDKYMKRIGSNDVATTSLDMYAISPAIDYQRRIAALSASSLTTDSVSNFSAFYSTALLSLLTSNELTSMNSHDFATRMFQVSPSHIPSTPSHFSGTDCIFNPDVNRYECELQIPVLLPDTEIVKRIPSKAIISSVTTKGNSDADSVVNVSETVNAYSVNRNHRDASSNAVANSDTENNSFKADTLKQLNTSNFKPVFSNFLSPKKLFTRD
jgi:hypothetical protein